VTRAGVALAFVAWACAASPPEPAPAPTPVPETQPVAAPSPAVPEPTAAPDAGRAADAEPDAVAARPAAPAEPAWLRKPFDDLPASDARGRAVAVIIEIAVQGGNRPLVLRIPETGVRQEIYDDRASTPGCRDQRRDADRNAIFLGCSGIDGGVTLRAYQRGDELVVETHGYGDVRPSLDGRHTFPLPKGRRLKLVARVPNQMTSLPGVMSSGP
jgi:hypothetical protein